MRILGLIYFDGIGGAEKFIFHLAHGINQVGHQYDILLIHTTPQPKQWDELKALAEEKEVSFQSLYYNPYWPLRLLMSLHKTFENTYDIINSHLPKADLLASVYKKLRNKKAKIVSTKHGYKDKYYMDFILRPTELPKNYYYYIYKLAESGIDGSYCCSYSLRNFLIDSSAQPKNKPLEVIQHGFDFEDPQISKKAYKDIDKLSLVMLGRLHKIKGHHFALEAISKLSKDIDIELKLLGDGDEREALEILAADLGLKDKVHFLGFQKDINSYLTTADAMLVSSYVEGLPLMILEAFNAELPVIAWDIPGVNELIEDKLTGLLVEPYKVEKLSEVILEFHKNRKRSRDIIQRAKERLNSHFKSERMIKETLEFFKSHSPD